MAIEIRMTKIYEDEKKCYRIDSISGLKREEELPRAYTKTGYPYAYLDTALDGVDEITCACKSEIDLYGLEVGESYLASQIHEMLDYIRASGDRLHEIRAKQKKEAAEWQGEETVVI